jgi:crotonobetaine/carnitine-CoA ligase
MNGNEQLPFIFADKNYWIMARILEYRAENQPDRPFLQFEDAPALSYREVNEFANRVAHGLRPLGVGHGDRVLILMDNSLEYLYCTWGINKLRAIWVPVHTAYKGYFLEHVANNSGAQVAVVSHNYLDRLAEVSNKLMHLKKVICAGALVRDTSALRTDIEVLPWTYWDSCETHNIDEEPKYYDIAAIMYTSGTTGPSKGVILPNAYFYSIAETMRCFLRLTEHDVAHAPLPMYHGAAHMFTIHPMLLLGGKAVIYRAFSASSWIDQVRRCGATYTCLVGSMIEFILRQPPREDDRDNNLRCVMSYPAPADMIEPFCKRFGVERVLEAAGQTEAVCYTYMPYDEVVPGSCGKKSPWYELRIVDPETDEEVPTGQTGEMIVRPLVPWCNSLGYWNMPEATVQSYRNLWFHTGDAFYCDERGYYYFVDRLKDVIRRRGENVSSLEIEALIRQHPSVVDVAVVAVRSQTVPGEDEIKACLVLKPGDTFVFEDFIRWCEKRLPYFAVPRYVEILDDLPRTPTAKVQKHILRERGVTQHTFDRQKAGLLLEEELKKQKMRSTQ